MGIFGRNPVPKLLSELAERLESAERDIKRLRLEWEDSYDRLRHIMGRLNKRISSESTKPDSLDGRQELEGDRALRANDGQTMTERQRAVMEMIRKRRGGTP